MADVVVNAVGEQCPIPAVKAAKALDAMREAGVLTVHVDNEIAVQNVMRLAGGRGLAARSEKTGDKLFIVRMEVGGRAGAQAAEPALVCAPDKRSGIVVAIDTQAMGRGDDALGKTLMKGFIYALSQLDELPDALLFYNGGAFLTTEGSAALEDLKNMEAQGVEMLTCGTCLDFFGLTEKLAVGRIANMYTIAQMLCGADKVVRP